MSSFVVRLNTCDFGELALLPYFLTALLTLGFVCDIVICNNNEQSEGQVKSSQVAFNKRVISAQSYNKTIQ